MSKVIKVENLSKAYQLGEIGTGTISRDLERYWARVRGKEDPFLKIGEVNDRTIKSQSDIVWGLKDLNFEIEQGDAVGIIGSNGAGKSTLLKILSRVTAPTTGSVKIKGRIASLLEVGTGFHPELSGKENIYLNGAILGMRKAEIKRKFDEIVDFSGVDRYIDTPVKRYSSGMYVRLAFAVAAHLESEIMIVDEVLAVGDAEFQKKCLGKMGDVSNKEGRTVLFVSHNMGAITRLCNHSLLLRNGLLVDYGLTSKVITAYLNADAKSIAYKVWEIEDAPGNHIARIFSAGVFDENYEVYEYVDIRKPVIIKMEYEVLTNDVKLTHAFVFHNEHGLRLFDSHDVNSNWKSNSIRKKGKYVAEMLIPGNFFAEGKVKISPAVITSDPWELHAYGEDSISFFVKDSLQGDSARGEFVGNYAGIIRPLFNWRSDFIS
ncbi:MAG: lipopolysaccharide transport system ATP-binding protein [Mucilaginibacter sp.]|nr:lipopolysaccharide transport system ATP-binding protein [Mucilaginibacter sp.]